MKNTKKTVKKAKNKKIKLVIFDCYGVTLFGDYPMLCKQLAKRFKRDWKKLHDVFYYKYFNMAAERKITQKQAWILSVKETKLPVSWKVPRDMHKNNWKLNKPVAEFARKLGKETTTLMLSKNTRSQFAETEKKCRHKQYFKHVVNTWEIGLPKASKKTYNYITKRFKVKPQEIIYIDDQKNNLVEAKKMGIHTILYKSFTQFKKDFNILYYSR